MPRSFAPAGALRPSASFQPKRRPTEAIPHEKNHTGYTGTCLARAWYDPLGGRFLSFDALGHDGSPLAPMKFRKDANVLGNVPYILPGLFSHIQTERIH